MSRDAACLDFEILPADITKVQDVLSLELLLWPKHTPEALRGEIIDALQAPDTVLFIAYRGNQPAGFAHCAIRHDYVEGTSGGAVGYLEGIYVREEYRKRGCARALLSACEGWARQKGCTEFASDCEAWNTQSEAFHQRMGFEVANRIVCFVKKL